MEGAKVMEIIGYSFKVSDDEYMKARVRGDLQRFIREEAIRVGYYEHFIERLMPYMEIDRYENAHDLSMTFSVKLMVERAEVVRMQQEQERMTRRAIVSPLQYDLKNIHSWRNR